MFATYYRLNAMRGKNERKFAAHRLQDEKFSDGSTYGYDVVNALDPKEVFDLVTETINYRRVAGRRNDPRSTNNLGSPRCNRNTRYIRNTVELSAFLGAFLQAPAFLNEATARSFRTAQIDSVELTL
jgi:hypothetical protein